MTHLNFFFDIPHFCFLLNTKLDPCAFYTNCNFLLQDLTIPLQKYNYKITIVIRIKLRTENVKFLVTGQWSG